MSETTPALLTEGRKLELRAVWGCADRNDRVSELCAWELVALVDEVAALREERDELQRNLVQANAVLEAVESAVKGVGVSDFMESFPVVRRVVDLQADVQRLTEALRQVREACQERLTPLVLSDGTVTPPTDMEMAVALSILCLLPPALRTAGEGT